jgi:hypothetical protein
MYADHVAAHHPLTLLQEAVRTELERLEKELAARFGRRRRGLNQQVQRVVRPECAPTTQSQCGSQVPLHSERIPHTLH